MPLPHIQRIRVANTADTAPVQVHPCSFKDVVLWHRHVHQPFISGSERVDADWNWPAFFVACHAIELFLGRQPLAFQLRVASPSGLAVPVGQVLLTLPYPWPGDARQRCVFVWFLSAAPDRALRHMGMDQRFSVLPPLLDVAVQLSQRHGMRGRIGLHAQEHHDAVQAAALVRRYQQLGLSRRPERRVGWFRPTRRDDGRLFYFDDTSAKNFAARQHDLR